MSERFKGVGVALVTPFDHKGNVDFGALENVLQHVTNGGVDYLVVLGTTSEAPTLNSREKSEIVDFIVTQNAGKIPVVLGVGGNNTTNVIEVLENTDFGRIDAILSVVPYYNKPNQAGLLSHFETIADKSPVPVILYNVPGRTSANLSAETTLRLSKHPNIIGTKEASGDFEQCALIAKDRSDDFLVLSGDDLLTLPILSMGGDGVISVIANALPLQFCQMVNDFIGGNISSSQINFHHLLRSMQLIFVEGNPAGVKEMLSQMDICEKGVRLPLVEASAELSELIRTELSLLKVLT